MGTHQRHVRRWVGLCQYKGLSKFYVGTVEAALESEALEELKKLWAKISPHPMPSMVEMHPGALILQLGDSE